MKKIVGIGAAVAVLSASYLGATYYSASTTKTEFADAISKLKTKYPRLAVTNYRFDQGFFTSSVSGTLEMLDCDEATSNLSTEGEKYFKFDANIVNGPFLGNGIGAAKITFTFTPEEKASPILKALAKSTKAQSIVSFNSMVNTKIELAEGSSDLDGRSSVKWAKSSFEQTNTLEGLVSEAGYNVPELVMTQKGKNSDGEGEERAETTIIKITGLQTQNSAANPVNKIMTTSKGTVSIDSFMLNGSYLRMPFILELNELKSVSSVDVKDGLASGKASLTAKMAYFSADKKRKLEFDNLQIESSGKNINIALLQSISDSMSTDTYSCRPKHIDREKAESELLEKIFKIASASPALAIDKLTLTSEGKSLDMSYSVAINDVVEKDLEEFKQNGVLWFAKKVAAKIDVKLPIAWLERAAVLSAPNEKEESVKEMVKQSLDRKAAEQTLKVEGENISTTFELKNGQMSINGQEPEQLF